MRILFLLFAMSGCLYAELGGGFYPRVHQVVTDVATTEVTRTDTSAWAVSLKVGFYFGVPIVRSGVGIGWSPSGWGTDLTIPRKHDAIASAGDGTTFRMDIISPFKFLRGIPHGTPRLTLMYSWYTHGGVRAPDATSYDQVANASGHRWYLGPSYGITGPGVLAMFGAGVTRATFHVPSGAQHDGLDDEAWGIGSYVMLKLTPTGHSGPLQLLTLGMPASTGTGGDAGCYYADHCDSDGHCESSYSCP